MPAPDFDGKFTASKLFDKINGQPGVFAPTSNLIVRETEASMRIVGAKCLTFMRRKIDDQ